MLYNKIKQNKIHFNKNKINKIKFLNKTVKLKTNKLHKKLISLDNKNNN